MKVSDIPSIIEEGVMFGNKPLEEVLKENFGFTVMGYRHYKKGCLTLQQHPHELSSLLQCVTNKTIVRNYLEIGLGTCVTIFVVDSYLRTMTSEYVGSLGLDIRDVSENFIEYANKQIGCVFCKTDILEYPLDKQYDLVMIDTNQSYGDMKKTFEKCKPNARNIAFHDIASGRYGAKRLFEELSSQYKSEKWIYSMAGIGLLRII